MKSICKTLSYIELILGAIGSIYLANTMGNTIDWNTLSLERDGILTFSIFIGGMFSTVILWAILNSFSQLLENQEKIIEQLRCDENLKNIKPICGIPNELPNQPSVSNTAKKVIISEKPSQITPSLVAPAITGDQWKKYDTWTCPNCKRINERKNSVCACGASMPAQSE